MYDPRDNLQQPRGIRRSESKHDIWQRYPQGRSQEHKPQRRSTGYSGWAGPAPTREAQHLPDRVIRNPNPGSPYGHTPMAQRHMRQPINRGWEQGVPMETMPRDRFMKLIENAKRGMYTRGG